MNRREMMSKVGLGAVGTAIGLGALTTSLPPAAETTAKEESKEVVLYVGTYTSGKSEGIYVYRLDLCSGALRFASAAQGVVNPSFLAFGPDNRFLYAVNEVSRFADKSGGAVTAFRREPKTGELTYLNQQASGGASPCHLSVDKTGKFVFVANYTGGSVAVLPIQSDGRLGELTDLVQHQGSSVNPQRQERPHPHSVNLDSANRYLFVPDLGLDKVMIYRVDLTHGKLNPNDEPWARVTAGAGPRHFAFHPNGRFAYGINELNSTLMAFAYTEKQGTLSEIETVSTLPEGFRGENHCADVHVSPSGKFLYGSNRGHDSIVIFAIEESTGRLTYVGHEPTQGKTPRNFAIDSTGTFLLSANQSSDTIVTFRIVQPTGRLLPTGQVASVPTPVCLKMVPASQ